MNPALFLSGAMLLFALVQSVFNRYLIAVGNPFSLLILLLLLQLNLGPPRLRAAALPPSPGPVLRHPAGSSP